MKKYILIPALLGVISVIGFTGVADSYFAADFMKVSDAEKKWGTLTLNPELFKAGNLSKRAPMSVDMAKRSL